MSDRHAIGSEPTPEPPSSLPSPRTEDARPAAEGWLERLFTAVGLRPASAREELKDALQEDEVDPAFSPEERMMLQNILGLRDTRVEDIMVARANVHAVEIGVPLADLIGEFQESGHSRMPVYRETLDDPVGMVHIKDLMGYFSRQAGLSAAEGGTGGKPAGFDLTRIDLKQRLEDTGLVRRVLFVPPSMPVTRLLATMQSSRTQMALVIDEYGGTDGLVSIEDAVETIVGEIEDEYDDEEPMLVAEGDGVFIADAAAGLDDVAARLGPAFAPDTADDSVETIGGVVFSLLGRIPSPGETVTGRSGYRFEILDADQRRIKKLRIVAPGPSEAQ